ncbi:MAG: hypothetical protein IJ424_01175 [Oscillospiraceae bacterium]|nr:hypothetical protein [Oscillospiraceae bacterium]
MPTKSYFLGCPTPEGFSTNITEDINSGVLFAYILKGGPGTGKSTLMKKVAANLNDAELYYCSSDPDSLDAVISREKGIIIVDGTAPHVFDPTYPGVSQRIVDLGQFWNKEKLAESKDLVITLTDDNKRLHSRGKRYLKAASGLYQDILAVGEFALNRQKLDAYAERLTSKLIPKIPDKHGKVSRRRITSITPKGIITQESAFIGCKLYYIDDSCIAVTDRLLKTLSVMAVNRGYDVIVSTNPILPDSVYDHIIIPKLGIAFTSKPLSGAQKINSLRFYDNGILKSKRKRLQFAATAGTELIKETANVLAKAKAVHDDLESHYIAAMNFDALNEYTKTLVDEICSRT